MYDIMVYEWNCTYIVSNFIYFSCECLAGWTQTEHCSPNISENYLCMPGYSGDNCKDTVCGDHGYAKALNVNEFMYVLTIIHIVII